MGALPAHAETRRAAIPVADPRPVVAPWAQAVDDGGAAANTTVIFSIYSASGTRVWSAWYSHVNWQSDERTRLRVWWATAGMAPGPYRLSVAVVSADRKVTLARVENAGTIQVPPGPAHAGAPSSRDCRCIVGRERGRASSTTT